MDTLGVPAPVREKIGIEAADGLVMMFADAHRLATESFERRLGTEMFKLRLEMAELRFELLKWSFLFWIGQLAAITGVLALMLRGGR
jgi:hypothetical protein